MEWITHFQSWVALATLTALEIVLGIDNIFRAIRGTGPGSWAWPWP
jgi:predicted tellurium resistance membrane protein TerC